MIGAGDLERLRTHVAGLEMMLGIVDRLGEDESMARPEGHPVSVAIEKVYEGLETLERHARRDLETEEIVALRRMQGV